MPIYSYRCTTEKDSQFETTDENGQEFMQQETCDHVFDVLYTSVTKAEIEEPDEACPKCGGKEKERLVSKGTSHILKGKGWYKDGY